MQGPFRAGDIVGADRKGRHFLALVVSETKSELHVQPLRDNDTYYTVSKRDVKGLWRHSKGVFANKTPNGPLVLG